MQRLPSVELENATGKAETLLSGVKSKLGSVPNIFKAFANSPAALKGYLDLSGALSTGVLSSAVREQIALAVAGENGCDYCASAHTAIGSTVGVPQEELTRNLSGDSSDPRVKTLLSFAKSVVKSRGVIADSQLTELRQTNFTDEEIVEVIANVALNIFTNYFNHIVNTEIDFPVVNTEQRRACAA